MAKQPIIVTGCPRSGAGITAGVLHLCGANGGNSLDERVFTNEKAYGVIKKYMASHGMSSQYPIWSTDSLSVPVDWKATIINTIEKDGVGEKDIWFIKASEASLTWPVWHQAFPDAKWVIVRRRTGDIINSCKKTAHMQAFKMKELQEKVGAADESEGWLWWVHQYEKRFVEMITAGLDCKVVWPQRMVFGDFQQVHQLLSWCGLKWRSDVLGFVDQKLEKTRIKEGSL